MTDHRRLDLDGALQEALGGTLRAPEIPPDFRARLQAALVRARETDLAAVRERLELERRQQLQELETHYLRVRRSTLGTLIGVAFAAGAAVTVALPWLRAHLGEYAPVAITWGAAALGLGMAFPDFLRRLLQRGSDVG